MTLPSGHEALFWNRVLTAAEAIEDTSLSAPAVSGLLLALDEGFGDLLDPVQSFEAYAVLRLCRAVRARWDDDGARPR